MKHILEIEFDEPSEDSTLEEDLIPIKILTMCKLFVSSIGDMAKMTLYVEDEEHTWEVRGKEK